MKNFFSFWFKDKRKPDNRMPGLEMIGRGILLKLNQPYDLKKMVFNPCWTGKKTFSCENTGKVYAVPDNCDVTESPPMPTNETLEKTVIEKSGEYIVQQLNIDGQIAASDQTFCVDVNMGLAQQLHRFEQENSLYALKSFFIPFWMLYLTDTTLFPFKKDKLYQAIPTQFDHDDRKKYEDFFECYGSHYVKRVWVGGKATLAFTVAQSNSLTQQDIYKNINAHLFLLEVSQETTQKSLENFQNQIEYMTVVGQGGDESLLTQINPLDKPSYKTWLESIKQNPNVIAFEVAGIWTLIPDQKKAKALKEAYKAATLFTPISAIFRENQQVNFIRGRKCTRYNIETDQMEKPQLTKKLWPGLETVGFERIDAAFNVDNVDNELNNKVFFFKGNQCVRYDLVNKTVDANYPKLISEEWQGLNFDRIDAALAIDSETAYFFRGPEYVRYNLQQNQIEKGYPKLFKEKWYGLTFERIDAAIHWGDGKAYFFRGDEYLRYDLVEYRSDPGYPKKIVGSYVEDWKFNDQPPSSYITQHYS